MSQYCRETDKSCVPIPCDRLDVEKFNGEITDNDRNFTVNDKAHFRCHKGFIYKVNTLLFLA